MSGEMRTYRERARIARDKLRKVFSDPDHRYYLEKDNFFADRYEVSRHTISAIRGELEVPIRSRRIEQTLDRLDTSAHTIRQLSTILGIDYQNVYKIIKSKKLPVLKDETSVLHLKQFATRRDDPSM